MSIWTRAADLGTVSKPEALAAFNRLEYASTVEHAAREADLVIEAVPEELESKIEIFTLLDKICRPQTILVSNTSSFSVSEIASVTYRAAKIAGMRFAKPVFTSKNLQIVRAQLTDDETIAACTEVGKRMGKQVKVIAEGVMLKLAWQQPTSCAASIAGPIDKYPAGSSQPRYDYCLPRFLPSPTAIPAGLPCPLLRQFAAADI